MRQDLDEEVEGQVKAVDVKFPGIFVTVPRLEIPRFQRPYVWGETDNWQPLWNDIRKAAEQVEAENAGGHPYDEPPTYFLGAVVLQERSFRPKRLKSSFIIDGQQRLTTLQCFIAAARAVAEAVGAHEVAGKLQDHVETPAKHVHAEAPEDRHRVWPLPQDRVAFQWAVRPPEDTSTMPTGDRRIAEARQWFETELQAWANESDDPCARLDALQFAIDDRLQFVQIVLEKTDDPQVIFESLNHRGVRLDAADLIKNLLFQALETQDEGDEADHLLVEHWLPLDSSQWRASVTTGRIKRAQVDILLSYFLTITTGDEVLIEHLFTDFKQWMVDAGAQASQVIKRVRHYADSYLKLRGLPLSTRRGQLIDRLETTLTNTPWPILLYLKAAGADDAQAELAAQAIDSFLMRRNVCGLRTNDYNRLFLQVLTLVQAAPLSHAGQAVVNALDSQQADSRYWPKDDEFRTALVDAGLYQRLVSGRRKGLMVGLENHLRTDKSEHGGVLSAQDSSLTIEHLMPQKWEKTWPLPEASDAKVELRNLSIHKLGNLTLLTTKMNPSLSNKPWPEKRKGLQSHSLTRLTNGSVLSPPSSDAADLDDWAKVWDEQRIKRRGAHLASQAISAWPRLTWSYVPAGAPAGSNDEGSPSESENAVGE